MTDARSPGPTPEGLAALLELLEERFELEWDGERRPRIDAFWQAVRLDLTEADRPAVLRELVKADLDHQWRRGAAPTEPLATGHRTVEAGGPLPSNPRLEEYAVLLPELGPIASWPAALIVEEYRVRQRWGDRPTHADYLARFPHGGAELEAALRQCDKDMAGEKSPVHADHTLGVEVEPSQAPLSGQRTFGDYDLLEELGRGGMGVVYKARQRRLDRMVALKIIRPDRLDQVTTLQRFQREIKAAARLAHANIVTIYDAAEVDGVPFLSMELITGMNLLTRVSRGGSLPVPLARECVRQTALGLQHVFERNLVHRDIKPSNLMLSNDGIVKLLDLGLARLFAEDDGSVSAELTRESMLLGTPDYVSPEQAVDAHSADIRSDLYSLGCTAFYLLTGTEPFSGGTTVQKVDRHRWEAVPLVRQRKPDIPAELEYVIYRLMAKRPEDRYATPADLVVALDETERAAQRAAAQRALNESPSVEVRTDAPRTSEQRAGQIAMPEAVREAADAVRQFVGHLDSVENVAFSPDGKRVATASLDRTTRLWDVATGTEVARLARHQGGVLCTAFTPDGRGLVTGSRDHTLRQWDLASGREVRCYAGHSRDVNSLALTPNGRYLLSAGSDQTLRVWDMTNGKEIRRIGSSAKARHPEAFLYVAALPDGRRALTGSRDRTMRLWDLDSGNELCRFPEHSVAVYCVACSRDGRFGLSAGGNSVRLFDLASGQLVRRFKGHTKSVLSVAFAPDGQRLVSASKDDTLRLWNVNAESELDCWSGHKGHVLSVAFAPDGRMVVSGSGDRTALLWQVEE